MHQPQKLTESTSTYPTTYCSSLLTANGITTSDKSWVDISQNFIVTIDPADSGTGYFVVDLSFASIYNDESEHNVFAQVQVLKGSSGTVAGAIQERHAKSAARSAILRGVFQISSTDEQYVFIPQWKVDGGTGHIEGVPDAKNNLITNFLVVWKIGDSSMAIGGNGANS